MALGQKTEAFRLIKDGVVHWWVYVLELLDPPDLAPPWIVHKENQTDRYLYYEYRQLETMLKIVLTFDLVWLSYKETMQIRSSDHTISSYNHSKGDDK